MPLGLEGPLRLLSLLAKNHIPFVVVGGAALALHGIPRNTLDVDIIVPVKTEIIFQIFSLTAKAGFISKQKDILNIADKQDLLIGQWVTFSDRHGNELIDILLEDSGLFEKIYLGAVKKRGKGFNLYVAGLKDLEIMKKAAGRPIDLADIALIKERQKRRL